MTYNTFLRYISNGLSDTWFSYPGNEDCVIGWTNQVFYSMSGKVINDPSKPFWAGTGCDVLNGISFHTAEELLTAPIYGGRSIKDRWDEITWDAINGAFSAEDIDKLFPDG